MSFVILGLKSPIFTSFHIFILIKVVNQHKSRSICFSMI